MKINLSDIFDNIDTEEISKIPESTFNTKQMNEITKRVSESTLHKLGLDEKNKKILHFPIKRLIAVACAILIIAGGTTVGATNYFKPDNALNQMIELNSKVDYSTLGTDVDATASSNDLDFHIKQVLCDNNVMMLPIECPKYNGRYIQPMVIQMTEDMPDDIFRIYINGTEVSLDVYAYNNSEKTSNENKYNNIFYITLRNLKNIRNNSQIRIEFTKLEYFDAEDEHDACDLEGNWEFNFTINRSNARKALEVNDLVFENGERYYSKGFTISPIGFTYNFGLKYEKATGEYNATPLNLPHKMPKALEGSSIIFSEHLARSLQGKVFVEIEMKDGTIYTDGDNQNDIKSNCGTTTDNIFNKTSGCVNATFNSAIDIENIKTIKIVDKVLYEA